MRSWIKLLRPKQWLKNLMLFFPPFLAGETVFPGTMVEGLLPFTVFCLASSATYVFNDTLDADKDALHPRKQHRPVASGKIPRKTALYLTGILVLLAFCGAMRVSDKFLILVLVYVIVSCLYTLKLKEVPVVDIFCIAAGFLFRLEPGGEAFKVIISDWLFLSVFLLSLFLSAGKRLGEIMALGETAAEHRKTLDIYSKNYLQGAMFMTGAVVLVTYTMYVISRNSLVSTVPLCAFGLMRYVLRVESGQGGDPTESLLRDGQLFVVSLLWVVMVGWGIYR
jgi:4-hydroxybenzoate polyprenyltransferase